MIGQLFIYRSKEATEIRFMFYLLVYVGLIFIVSIYYENTPIYYIFYHFYYIFFLFEVQIQCTSDKILGI